MRLLGLCTIVLLAGCSAPQPFPQAQQPVEMAGRVAGAPVHCLPSFDQQQLHISENDRSSFVYGSGKTIWINRLGPACNFSWSNIPIFEVNGSSYCSGDIVRSVDQSTHVPGPSCVLGDFIPYTRP